jgi:Mrp family chromosome partitioning ATPase
MVLVTSPVGDAQPAASLNLAAALAEQGKQVILVNSDLRRPSAPTPFRLDPERSLGAALDGRIAITYAVQDTPVPGLRVVPAGRVRGSVAAALHGAPLRQALRRLRTAADIVVIDGPATLAGADVATLTELSDLVLLVADARRTTRGQIRAAVGQLDPVRAKLVGSLFDNARGRVRSFPVEPPPVAPPRERGRNRSANPVVLGASDDYAATRELDHTNGWADPATNGKR